MAVLCVLALRAMAQAPVRWSPTPERVASFQSETSASPAPHPFPAVQRLAQLPADPPANVPAGRDVRLPPLGPPPAPATSPFRTDQIRLPLLPFAATPQPSAATQEKFGKYVDRTLDVENILDLVQGRPRLLVLRQPPLRIQVADEAIANYILVTEREISISGLQVGTTVLNLWFQDPEDAGKQEILSYLVRVVPDPEAKERLERIYQALESEINRNFPDSAVRLSLVGDKLLLRGQAKDIEDARHILDVVGANAPGGAETIPLENVNVNLYAAPAAGELPVDDSGEVSLANYLARPNSTVINMLHIPGVQQVMLKVTVAEVNRSAARAIGAEMEIGNIGNAASFFSLLPVGTTGGNVLINRGDFELAINALKSINLARTLAEPNLVTLSGRAASFQAGGSFPVPQISGFTAAGLQGVEFVPFGVQVQFVPVVTDTDLIRMRLSATVSTRDEQNAVDVAGTNVPSLSTRNFQTVVELREGQTLAIAGLLQTSYGADSTRVPFAGDVPGLGRLFSSDRNSYDEQELVVLVTPYLVQSLDQHECVPLPGSDMFEPTDVEFFLLGRLDSRYREDYRTPVRNDCERMKAFHRCHQQFIIGDCGYTPCRQTTSELPVQDRSQARPLRLGSRPSASPTTK